MNGIAGVDLSIKKDLEEEIEDPNKNSHIDDGFNDLVLPLGIEQTFKAYFFS